MSVAESVAPIPFPRLQRGKLITDGLIACWPFYEGSGDVLHDISGNDLHGTLTNMDPPTDWVGGLGGWALDFEGAAGSHNDVITLGDPTGLQNLTVFSIVVWNFSRSAGEGDFGRIYDKEARKQLIHWKFGGEDTIALFIDWSSSDGQWRSSTSITHNKWNHLAVAYDGSSSSNDPTMWINGLVQSLTESPSPSGSLVSDVGQAARIGNNAGGSRTLDGILFDMRIYNRLLSHDEVQMIYAGVG